jgi:hypothetical protein
VLVTLPRRAAFQYRACPSYFQPLLRVPLAHIVAPGSGAQTELWLHWQAGLELARHAVRAGERPGPWGAATCSNPHAPLVPARA